MDRMISRPIGLTIALLLIGIGLWMFQDYRLNTGQFSRLPLKSNRPTQTNEHPVDQSNSVSLKGFEYTVMRVRHEDSIGFATAENGASYLVVDFKVENQTPRTAECYAKFHIFSSEGLRYNVDDGATWNAKNGHLFGVDILPKFSKSITVAFLVPTESLSQPLTLDIEDGLSSGMVKIGPASGTLARD